LEVDIQQKDHEVGVKINELEDSILEWQTANFLLSDNCRVANYCLAERFHSWHQTVPLLQSWLGSEDKLHQTVYWSAFYAAYQEELNAMGEMRSLLSTYTKKEYKDLAFVKVVPQLKNLNEQRQSRSETFDHMYTNVAKQLKQTVRQCDKVFYEIQEREKLW
jgi:hypothetical protein